MDRNINPEFREILSELKDKQRERGISLLETALEEIKSLKEQRDALGRRYEKVDDLNTALEDDVRELASLVAHATAQSKRLLGERTDMLGSMERYREDLKEAQRDREFMASQLECANTMLKSPRLLEDRVKQALACLSFAPTECLDTMIAEKQAEILHKACDDGKWGCELRHMAFALEGRDRQGEPNGT